MKFKKIMVVINPAAGKDEPILNTINDVFYQYDLEWDMRLTHKFGDAIQFAKEAAEQGFDLVAGYGGDGTQMEIATGVMESNLPMAILPGGTGNAMAFELKIPRDLRQAVELICTSDTIKAVDLAQAGNAKFMLRLYSGVEEEQKTSREMKDKYGVLAYPMSTVQMARNLNHANYKMTIDGELVEEDGVSLMVLNAGSTGGIDLAFAGGVDITDGLLDIFMLDTTISSTLSATARFLQLPTETAGYHYWRGREIVLEADPPQTIWIDGELLGPTPITITAVPAAVSIVVPNPS